MAFLISKTNKEAVFERVAAVCETTDGFDLAERDLGIRGSGELLGTQQSGFSEMLAFDPVEDHDVLLRVREAVRSAGRS